jgi:hypothetical protein
MHFYFNPKLTIKKIPDSLSIINDVNHDREVQILDSHPVLRGDWMEQFFG